MLQIPPFFFLNSSPHELTELTCCQVEMLKSATSLLQADGSFPEREMKSYVFHLEKMPKLTPFPRVLWTQDLDLNLFRHSCASSNLSGLRFPVPASDPRPSSSQVLLLRQVAMELQLKVAFQIVQVWQLTLGCGKQTTAKHTCGSEDFLKCAGSGNETV